MEQIWLDQLVEDAERVADAAVRLMRLKVDRLLASLTEARRAQDDQARETAYNSLQNELVPVLRALEPITLYDLQTRWILHRGFRQSRLQSIGFWALSVVLLILVGYLTSLYDRAANVAQTIDSAQHGRLAEQAIKLFYVAREHSDEIANARANTRQALASQSFFRDLGDLQEAHARAGSLITDSHRLYLEIQFWNRRFYDLCRVTNIIVGSINMDLECVDPALEDALPSLQKVARQPNYPNGPPPNLAQQIAAAGITGPISGMVGDMAPSRGQQADELDNVYAFLADANLFFQRIGLNEIDMRSSSPLHVVYIQPIKSALSALRLWFIPAAYGCLGAAIFFTRRFLNPNLPNPDALRVIYRILFGGFAGIVFAWFWMPFQPSGGTIPLSSLSSFGVAFLAGYSTDILFEALDRMVEAASAQIRRSPIPSGRRPQPVNP